MHRPEYDFDVISGPVPPRPAPQPAKPAEPAGTGQAEREPASAMQSQQA